MDHRYRVFLVCVIGVFVDGLRHELVDLVAPPTIALEFGTDLPTAQWVVIGNGLTIAALLVPVGRLSEDPGIKPIYVIGCGLFAVGALLASVSSAIVALILARIVVGVGSAMTQGTAMAILVGNFEAGERAKVLGWQTGTVGDGAIAGPAAGGIIVGSVGGGRCSASPLSPGSSSPWPANAHSAAPTAPAPQKPRPSTFSERRSSRACS